MKKTVVFILVLSILSSAFSLLSSAVIQSPPKKENISAYVYKTEDKPRTDGIIKNGEYKKLNIPQSCLSFIVGSEADWARTKNTEPEAYAAVCSDTFYFALTVKIYEEFYVTECEPKYMWAQTALLLSFAKTGTTGRNALEIGIRTDGSCYTWNYYNGIEFSAENGFAAVYKDGVITYEIAVPLSAFGAENDTDFKFCFSVSIGDYFNGERQAYVQFGKGISGFGDESDADAGKDAAVFPTLTIIKEGDETTPADNEGDPVSPDTGINAAAVILFSAAVMTVSFSALYLLNKSVKRFER